MGYQYNVYTLYIYIYSSMYTHIYIYRIYIYIYIETPNSQFAHWKNCVLQNSNIFTFQTRILDKTIYSPYFHTCAMLEHKPPSPPYALYMCLFSHVIDFSSIDEDSFPICFIHFFFACHDLRVHSSSSPHKECIFWACHSLFCAAAGQTPCVIQSTLIMINV